MNKYKVVAFLGKSGAGKDYTVRTLCSNWPSTFHKVISDTTRPKRDYEEDGVDYYFIDPAEFASEVLNGNILEATCYNNDWYYGTNITSLNKEKINLAVLNPEGADRLCVDERIDLVPIVLYTDDKTRLLRALRREEDPDCHEICRRFLADEKMFENLKDELSIPFHIISGNNWIDTEKIFNLTNREDSIDDKWKTLKDKLNQFAL